MFTKWILEHDNVRSAAVRLKEMLVLNVRPDVQQLATLRWTFASALMQLLAKKERYIYTKLEQDGRHDVKQYFEKSKQDLQRRFDSYTEHMYKWPTYDTYNWLIYRQSAIEVVDLFLDRLIIEETELFPYMETLNLDFSQPCVAVSNWTRHAFYLKDIITVANSDT